MFPIKYIDNNLVWNKDNEVFAYYELIPYNYSFLSAEQKFIVHDSFRQLIAQSREGKIHALQIATESSIRSMQEQSKKLVTGKLKEVAYQKIDEQTEALVSMIGDNQVDYRFFLGFKLMVTEEQLNLKNIKKSAWLTFTEFLHEVNHTLMNDFVSMPNDEINRYMKMEKLLENKISRRFKVRRLEINDFGYLMEHLYGRDGIAYEDYEYQLPKKNYKKETLIKYYDLIRPTRCVIEESQRYLRLEHEDNNNLTIPQVVNRLGMVFFLLFFNLGITIFVFLLTGMMLFSQILFIIFAMFLPISFLLSMIPSYESIAKQAIVRVFNTIMTRAGITLIVTVAFSISSMFYNISTDYPFFMVAFLQIVCFAGIYMKLGDLMSMFSLNANDSQSMGRRIFRRPYLFMRHRARRMEHRIARAVSAGGISGGVAGAVAGSAVAGKRAERKNTASKENRGNTTSSMGQRAGSKVGAVLDTKNKVKDKANAAKENIKDMPTQTAYAVYSAKEKAKSSVSDFKRGMVQEQQSRQTGRLEKQARHRQNIADKRMELQKAQEARQTQRKADGSATMGATRPHERPATASTIPKPSAEKMQEIKRPATAPASKVSEPVKTNVIKERPLSSSASDKKATQPAQPVHRQNVEKVVSQETRQNDTKDRRTKVQQTQTVQKNQQTKEKNRSLVTKKGQKKK